MAESKLQSQIATWLRRRGCFVMVVQPQAGIPDGTPDVIALCNGGGWVALEVKASDPYKKNGDAKAGAFRPLQVRTVNRLDDMYFARIVWPENWNAIKQELEAII